MLPLPDDMSQTGEGQLSLLCPLRGEHWHRDQVAHAAADELQQVHGEPFGVLQLEGGIGVVDPEVDRPHHQLLAVLTVFELSSEGWITLT